MERIEHLIANVGDSGALHLLENQNRERYRP
jgi:hypothetical protein